MPKMIKIWKISQKEYNRIKDLNRNGFFNRKAIEYKGKFYEHDPKATLAEIFKWQKSVRESQAKAATQLQIDGLLADK